MNNRCGQQMRLCTGRKKRAFLAWEISTAIYSFGFFVWQKNTTFYPFWRTLLREKSLKVGTPYGPSIISIQSFGWLFCCVNSQVLDPIEIVSLRPVCPSFQLLKKNVCRQTTPTSFISLYIQPKVFPQIRFRRRNLTSKQILFEVQTYRSLTLNCC